MISLIILFTLHWIADFVLQSDEVAKNKSKKFMVLLDHTVTYACFAGFVYTFFLNPFDFILPGFNVFTILLVTHTLIDFFTSRWTSKLFAANQRHWFFVMIGFDQLLHSIILIFINSWITI